MLGFGLGLSHCGSKGGVADAPDFSGSAAKALAGGEANALALDFTDDHFRSTGFYGSAYILDAGTPANDYNSSPDTEASSLLSYSGSSAKLTMGPSGTLRYNAHNLYLNSASPANQSITVVSGASYAVTITGSVSVTASGAATGTWTAGTNTFTAATTTLTLGSTSGSGTVHVYRTPADPTYLQTAGAARYGLPYEWSTAGVPLGIRVEPTATNLLLYNTSFQSTQWSVTSATSTAAAAVAPDGTTTAVELKETTATAFHFIQQSASTAGLSITASTTHTLSIYVKDGTRRYVQLAFDDGTSGPHATYDLTSVSVTETGTHGPSGTYISSSIVGVGNGWYRLTLTGQVGGSTGDRVLVLLANSATPGWAPSYAGSTSNYVYIWGAQLETGTASSPILTYGATATRAADVGTRAVTGYPHSATVNSGLVQFVPLNAAAATAVVQLDDGTSNEVVSIGYDASANIGLTVTDGGAAQTAPLADGTVAAGSTETIGFSWKANDFLLSDNGATAVADTSGTLPTVTTLKIRASGGPILLRKLLLVPVEKAAAEVESYGATT